MLKEMHEQKQEQRDGIKKKASQFDRGETINGFLGSCFLHTALSQPTLAHVILLNMQLGNSRPSLSFGFGGARLACKQLSVPTQTHQQPPRPLPRPTSLPRGVVCLRGVMGSRDILGSCLSLPPFDGSVSRSLVLGLVGSATLRFLLPKPIFMLFHTAARQTVHTATTAPPAVLCWAPPPTAEDDGNT